MSFHNHIVPALAVLTLVGIAGAQSIDATYIRNYGNAEVGGQVRLDADASYRSGMVQRAELNASARATVRVGTTSREAARIAHNAYGQRALTYSFGRWTYSYRRGASTNVFIGGQNVYSRSRSYSYDFNANITPTSISLGSAATSNVTCGPFSVTVTNRRTAGANFSIEATISSSQRLATAQGTARTYANGSASVALGIPGISVGTSTTVQLANTNMAINLDARPGSVTGVFSWTMNAMRMFQQVWVQVGWARYTRTVFNLIYGFSSGSRTLN